MTSLFVHFGLFNFLRLFTSTIVAGWMSSPLSWSGDAEWLCYTVVTEPGREQLRPGWLFATSSDLSEPGIQETAPGRTAAASGMVYQIWATHRDCQTSALIEESSWPLTAPAWSARGKSIAFGRFVPNSLEPAQPVQRGRLEVVLQEGLDRKHVVWSSPEFELDPIAWLNLPHLSCSWSTDGLYLAIPRPGREPAIEIVRTDTKKRLHILDHATQSAWSPDGTKCAFIRRENNANSLKYVERRGQSFSDARPVAAAGPIASAPFWSSDSRSIIAVVDRTPSRSLELVRFTLEPTESSRRLMSLVPEPMRAAAKVRGLVIDFDRDAERCFFSVALAGRDADLVWSVPHEWLIHKRFHPLDVAQRIGDLAVAPNGELVAVRFTSPHGLTPPVVYDPETEQTVLLVPDQEARREWLGILAGTASGLLRASLPPAMADGQVAQRPSLLPLPGELSPHELAIGRLNRLARFGSVLCSRASDQPHPQTQSQAGSAEIEASLFFDYLSGDYRGAAGNLEKLEPYISSPQDRLSLLSLRAQILWASGERSNAQAVIGYLLSSGEPDRRLVEETPLGLAFSPYISPRRAWANYLWTRAAETKEAPSSPPAGDPPSNMIDPRLQDPLRIPDVPIIERGAELVPFAPGDAPRPIP